MRALLHGGAQLSPRPRHRPFVALLLCGARTRPSAPRTLETSRAAASRCHGLRTSSRRLLGVVDTCLPFLFIRFAPSSFCPVGWWYVIRGMPPLVVILKTSSSPGPPLSLWGDLQSAGISQLLSALPGSLCGRALKKSATSNAPTVSVSLWRISLSALSESVWSSVEMKTGPSLRRLRLATASLRPSGDAVIHRPRP